MKWMTMVLACVVWMGWVGQCRADSVDPLEMIGSARSPLMVGERLIFLGDSITDAGNHPDGYVDLIRQSIGRRVDLRVEVIGAGVGGNKVPDLQARLKRDVLERHPTLVFVYIGINDVWHNPGGTPIDRYEQGLRDVLQQIKQIGVTPVLATPSVIGERWDGGNANDAKLDAYAEVSRKVARELDVQLCDLRAAFMAYLREHNPDNAGQGFLTLDTVHLSKAGNRLVAEQAAGAIVQALNNHAGVIALYPHGLIDQTDVTILVRDPAHTRVFYTTDGTEPTESSTRYTGPFVVNQTTRVRAVGITDNGRQTQVDDVYEKVTPLAPSAAQALADGLAYRLILKGLTQLPDFAREKISAGGVEPRPQTLYATGVAYAAEFTGYLKVRHEGVYEFTLMSDDGSRLTIGDRVVVNNDGMHGPVSVSGQAALRAGAYPVRIEYFNGGGGAVLKLMWSRNGDAPSVVPDEAFGHDPQSAPTMRPTTKPAR